MKGEPGEVREERGNEHDALDADVDHAGALADDSAERSEREGRREAEDDREHVRENEDEVDRELPDEAQERADRIHQDGGEPEAAPPAQLCVTVLSPTVRISKPIVVRSRSHRTARTIRTASGIPRCRFRPRRIGSALFPIGPVRGNVNPGARTRSFTAHVSRRTAALLSMIVVTTS